MFRRRRGTGPDPETVRLIYEHLQHAPERQLADNNDLDTKVASLFAAASVIMGLASFGRLGTGTTGDIAAAVTGLLAGATVAYLGAALAALKHLKPVIQDRSVHATTLWDDFKDKSPAELQIWLIRQTKNAWEKNVQVTSDKARALRCVVIGLATEVLLVTTALIVSRF